MSSSEGDQPYTVVVGADGSPTGQAALRWAIDEARARHGRVRVIHAWMSPYDWQMEVLHPVDESALRAAAHQRLHEALGGVDVGDVAVEAELVEGEPRRVLLDAAREADLLVVGSHGHGRLAEALLGSVSSFCVHHATGPVVVIHAAEAHPGEPDPA
jgi:nucleotide-binding universal stress UspA family protein